MGATAEVDFDVNDFSSEEGLEQLNYESVKDRIVDDVTIEEIVKTEDVVVDIDKAAIVEKNIEKKAKVDKDKETKSSTVESELSDLKYEKIISTPSDKKEKVATTKTNTSSENKEELKQKISNPNLIIKIVLLESVESLPKSHKLYSTHENVKEIYHNGKFKYMFGEFKSMEEAKDFLNGSVKMVYPNAYIVKFN
jgi:hypothetical protein